MSVAVLVVGENSVLQKTCVIGELNRGEVNRIENQTVSASGKGLNVAAVLSALDVTAVLYGYAGGENGRRFTAECKETGIDARISVIAAETRQCMTLIERDGTTTEIVEPSPGITQAESRAFRSVVLSAIPEVSVVCISGTAVGNESEDAYESMVIECRKHAIPVILDAHKAHGLRALSAGPDILKVNAQELSDIHRSITGSGPSAASESRQERHDMAAHIIETYGVETVIVTRGRHGAEAYSSHGWASAASSITRVQNPIGCGDAFTAAVAQRVALYASPEDTSPPLAGLLRHGVTIATAHGLSMKPGHLDVSRISEVAGTLVVSGSESG
ncbi:MAG: hypothetical protein EA383_16280 [Spirochaetaceae bacterium]|nr:MAG: hypothetical protein EA383_16280 [Spirochaetaceae bacterium]